MHHRRRAAVRGAAQGKVQGDARQCGRAQPVSNPDPAHPQHGDERHPGYEHPRGGAAGPPPGTDLCGGARLGPGHTGDRTGDTPGRAGVLSAQPGGEHRQLRL